MFMLESDFWRPRRDRAIKRRRASSIKRAERAYRRVFPKQRAKGFEIRECAREVSAAGFIGGIESWPLGSMPRGIRRDFYGIYGTHNGGLSLSIYDSTSLRECRRIVLHLEKL